MDENIESISQLLININMSKGEEKDGEKTRCYYRGHCEENHSLVPKLLRKETFNTLSRLYKQKKPVKLQKALIDRFIRYVPAYYGEKMYPFLSGEKEKFCLCLCLAQHHGLPTLLLDWTLNPLAALYFTVTKACDQNGCLWCMKLKPSSERKHMTIHLEDPEAKIPPNPRYPLIIVPRPVTPRITAQTGRFIYSINDTPLNELNEKKPWRVIFKWKVSKEAKSHIREELENLQVHEGTMFPDLDGYARYLGSGGL